MKKENWELIRKFYINGTFIYDEPAFWRYYLFAMKISDPSVRNDCLKALNTTFIKSDQDKSSMQLFVTKFHLIFGKNATMINLSHEERKRCFDCLLNNEENISWFESEFVLITKPCQIAIESMRKITKPKKNRKRKIERQALALRHTTTIPTYGGGNESVAIPTSNMNMNSITMHMISVHNHMQETNHSSKEPTPAPLHHNEDSDSDSDDQDKAGGNQNLTTKSNNIKLIEINATSPASPDSKQISTKISNLRGHIEMVTNSSQSDDLEHKHGDFEHETDSNNNVNLTSSVGVNNNNKNKNNDGNSSGKGTSLRVVSSTASASPGDGVTPPIAVHDSVEVTHEPMSTTTTTTSREMSKEASHATSITMDSDGNLKGMSIVDSIHFEKLESLINSFDLRHMINLLVAKYTDIGSIPTELVSIHSALTKLGIINDGIDLAHYDNGNMHHNENDNNNSNDSNNNNNNNDAEMVSVPLKTDTTAQID